MKRYNFKNKLENGEVCYGSWITSSDIMICEIMNYIGFDWYLIDTEHAFINIESLRDMLIVLRKSETIPIVRVNANDKEIIKQVLDVGAEGVLIPMINTKDEAEKAVAACLYPPKGIRGFGPLGASNYVNDFEEYVNSADERIMIFIQIESIEAVQNIDEILEVERIDGIFIGPGDLSASMGYFNNPAHPEVIKVIKEIISKCQKNNVVSGFACGGTPENIKDRLNNELSGVQFITVASDIGFVFAGGREVLNKLKGGE